MDGARSLPRGMRRHSGLLAADREAAPFRVWPGGGPPLGPGRQAPLRPPCPGTAGRSLGKGDGARPWPQAGRLKSTTGACLLKPDWFGSSRRLSGKTNAWIGRQGGKPDRGVPSAVARGSGFRGRLSRPACRAGPPSIPGRSAKPAPPRPPTRPTPDKSGMMAGATGGGPACPASVAPPPWRGSAIPKRQRPSGAADRPSSAARHPPAILRFPSLPSRFREGAFPGGLAWRSRTRRI